jgi:hypothetical protein
MFRVDANPVQGQYLVLFSMIYFATLKVERAESRMALAAPPQRATQTAARNPLLILAVFGPHSGSMNPNLRVWLGGREHDPSPELP